MRKPAASVAVYMMKASSAKSVSRMRPRRANGCPLGTASAKFSVVSGAKRTFDPMATGTRTMPTSNVSSARSCMMRIEVASRSTTVTPG
ncbi:hypothetical protein G6F63_016835 [Rhizopus arrhizus]|nr:hypothetical protein G6F63_016835 [Rhizopus arrhizus]